MAACDGWAAAGGRWGGALVRSLFTRGGKLPPHLVFIRKKTPRDINEDPYLHKNIQMIMAATFGYFMVVKTRWR